MNESEIRAAYIKQIIVCARDPDAESQEILVGHLLDEYAQKQRASQRDEILRGWRALLGS